MSPPSTQRRNPDFRPAEPFNTLPALPPRADVESRPILKACIGARAAVAELNAAADLIPTRRS